eukprot:scaffold34593_cov179-Amphora_coffeaeformis.AAC.13
MMKLIRLGLKRFEYFIEKSSRDCERHAFVRTIPIPFRTTCSALSGHFLDVESPCPTHWDTLSDEA